ncbi:cyclin-G2 isoform X1 [Eucyclogobius newberryi]|uniref:cyclin-G2 isoform X1 n=1 Tax=Eucyclogobius newberryi TaxID=166745 RepID=UPI003B5926F7
MKDLQCIDTSLLKELKICCAKETNFLPRESGLKLMESASTEVPKDPLWHEAASQFCQCIYCNLPMLFCSWLWNFKLLLLQFQDHKGVSAKSRDTRVEDLWSLINFFGYSTQTFVQSVSLLDRFLTIMKVQPKHLPCIGVCCLHIAAKMVEEEGNISPTHEIIRISQSKFTVSDLGRMEKIISDKLHVEPKAVTALTFLHLYYKAFVSMMYPREEIPSILRLEAQLKACLCRLVFSKAKPSVLALALIAHEIETHKSISLLKIVQQLQRNLKISDSLLLHWKELVAGCMAAYCSKECVKPDHRKLVWIVSRRTAQSLQANHFRVPILPTIPEGNWDEIESEDSYEDMISGEDSPCGSPGSDGEGAFFPTSFLKCRK